MVNRTGDYYMAFLFKWDVINSLLPFPRQKNILDSGLPVDRKKGPFGDVASPTILEATAPKGPLLDLQEA
jgi:hypothetical protein